MSFTENSKNGVVYMTADNIHTTHAFTTRLGGVSRGIFRSLNLAVSRGDDAADVEKNYSLLCSCLDISMDSLVFSHQVHGDIVRTCSSEDYHTLFTPVPYDADGLITAEANLPLIIFTADCMPILLFDRAAGAIGAVHAGWRGTAADIAGKAVIRMAEEFGCRPENIQAAIGPGIGFCCYETDSEVPEAMARLPVDCEKIVRKKEDGKFMVDLKGINLRLLENAGLLPEHISVSDECTMCSHDKYWSHRYTHGMRGTQASVIMLKGISPSETH